MADHVQHGIDDNPSGDAEKGAALGGLGGAAVGAAAGSLAGPVGTLIGAAVGAVSGAIASGVAVAAVDAVDNDNTVSGVGTGTTGDLHTTGTGTTGTLHPSLREGDAGYTTGTGTDAHGHNVVTGDEAHTGAGKSGLATGAIAGGLIGTAVGGPVGAVVGGTLGSLAGGVAGDATEATDEGRTPGAGYASTGSYGSTMNTTDVNYGTTGTAGYVDTTDTRPTVTRAEYDRLSEPERLKVRLVEEELHVNKESRQTGEVEISKRVVEEQVSVPVTLEREEVIIHRHAATGDATGVIGDGETIVVPVREEFANVSKTSHVTGEVEIEKRVTSTEKTVSDTVRREELVVDGDVVEDTTTKY
ncbi:MAG TPA: YsnF/AvaK domain-containing protein [Abditibacterium sp.]|jgi:uncharacterized protein (TIGR02271 family)